MNIVVEGKAFIKNKIQQVCIGIENGRISKIAKILPKGEENYRFKKEIILPAGIDIHVHFREPGFTYKEDFSTGTISAAFGGISCIFDMPNTKPPTVTKKTTLDKIELAKKKAYIDFGLYTGITDENFEKIEDIAKYCNAFKIYLGSSTNTLLLDEKNLKEFFTIIEESSDKPIMIHAEDEKCLNEHKKIERNLTDHLRARPDLCEVKAIQNILKYRNKKNKIHICHVSSADSIELLKNKKDKASIGVTPHHVIFSKNIKKKTLPDSFYKVNPPLRTEFDVETLREHLTDGFIDILESDHSPHTYEEKNVDFDEAPSGLPGVETMYPIFLFWLRKNLLPLHRIVSLLCKKPAEILNIKKGEIAEGKDADLIIVDMKNIQKIKTETLHYKCEWTPYEGMQAIFPRYTFVRGKPVIEDYTLVGKKGYGKQVKNNKDEQEL